MRRAAALVTALVLTGCSSASDEAVASTARSFAEALRADDGQAACALLAPRTLEELELSSGQPCDSALPALVTPADEVRSVQRFGRQGSVLAVSAQDELDTWFLSRFDDRWLVVAASCGPRSDLPYDCDVEGA